MAQFFAESPTVRAYRELLGVTANAGADELKKAYHRLALIYHPDRNESLGAAEDFQNVREAFTALSDTAKIQGLNRSHLNERLFDTIVEGLNISFGAFFGYRVFGGSGSRVEKKLRLGREKAGESDADAASSLPGPLERDQSILDSPAHDAIEIVYAGKFSLGDDQRLKQGLAGSHVVRLPWVVLNNQGLIHFLNGDLEKARACYSELNERIPNNIIFMYRLGLCHVLVGFKEKKRSVLGFRGPNRREVDKGVRLFRQCIALGENRTIGRQSCLLIRKFLADTLAHLGLGRQALKVWREILKQRPQSIEATLNVKGKVAAKALLRSRQRYSSAAVATTAHNRLLKGR